MLSAILCGVCIFSSSGEAFLRRRPVALDGLKLVLRQRYRLEETGLARVLLDRKPAKYVPR